MCGCVLCYMKYLGDMFHVLLCVVTPNELCGYSIRKLTYTDTVSGHVYEMNSTIYMSKWAGHADPAQARLGPAWIGIMLA